MFVLDVLDEFEPPPNMSLHVADSSLRWSIETRYIEVQGRMGVFRLR